MAETPERMAPDRARIVVVDDDDDILMWCRFVLEKAGYCVETFSDLQKAYECLLQDRPALVITDLMMDSLDAGFTFARRVKEDPALTGVPVIIMTAVESQRGFDFTPRTSHDLEAMNADAFFSKPVEPAKLVAKIAELLMPR